MEVEKENECVSCVIVCVCINVYIAFWNPKEKKRELKAFNSKQCVELNQRIFRTVKLKGGGK